MERARRHSAALPANAVSLGETLTSRSLAARNPRGLTLVAPASPVLSPIPRPVASRHAPSVYLAGLAESSRRAQKIALQKIASYWDCDFWSLPWAELRFEHTSAIRAKLADQYKPATARRMLCALKGALKAAWRLGQFPKDEPEAYQRAVDLPAIKGKSLPKSRALSPGEVRAIFAVCAADPGVIGVRDAALFALLFGAGPRRAEATALTLADYNPETGAISIQKGKGNKGRVTYLGESAREVVNYWLEFRGSRAGAIIAPLTRSGRILRRALGDQSVFAIARKRALEAGIRAISPHDWRHTMATNLIDNGVDIFTVQELLGHASPETTAQYNHTADAKKAKAAEGIFIPFARPSLARRR